MKLINNIVPVILVRNDCYWLPYCLAAVKGWFSRFVIYDIGSTDGTEKIIKSFISNSTSTEFFHRQLPFIEPEIQGIFRNSMIAESQSDWYLILDADEVWTQDSLANLEENVELMQKEFEQNNRVYGIIRRLEVSADLRSVRGMNENIPHHRLYHRLAIWTGTHPGEVPFVPQRPSSEVSLPNMRLFHFHQPDRSPLDETVPRRISRRYKNTYLRGKPEDVNLLEELPILQKPVGNCPVNKNLKELQDEWN